MFINRLQSILNYVTNKYYKYNIIIGGDFNINLLQHNIKTCEYLDLMLEHKFTQHINAPTHITQTTETCLDHIFTNFKPKYLETKVEELGFSDHSGVIIDFKIPKILKRDTWIVEKRLFNKKAISQFRAELKLVNWDNIIKKKGNINENYEAFHNKIKEILNTCIPNQKVKLKNNYKKYWLTKGIKKSCQHKRLLKIFALRSNNRIINNYYVHDDYEIFLQNPKKYKRNRGKYIYAPIGIDKS